jgi:hypothetical protein
VVGDVKMDIVSDAHNFAAFGDISIVDEEQVDIGCPAQQRIRREQGTVDVNRQQVTI